MTTVATQFLFRTLKNVHKMSLFFPSEIPVNIFKAVLPGPQSINTLKRCVPFCTKTSLLFTVAECLCADKENKLIQPPSPHKLSYEYMITQASTSTVTANQQLLTVTLAAIVDTAKSYRDCMEHLMNCMEESLHVQGPEAAHAAIWDEVVAMRGRVADCKKRLQELSSFMEYVDKSATSAAETAYLSGAENMSTVMCETMNSAHAKLEDEYEQTKRVEKELLKQQEIFVRRACELEKELKRREKERECLEKQKGIPAT